DDDRHHPQRIASQLSALNEAGCEAVCLQDVMHFFSRSRALYVTNWRATETKAHPGTLLCRRNHRISYPETGATASLGEDGAVLLEMMQRGGAHSLTGQPHLYIYVNHGAN